jgi:hypothetical protein
MDPEELLTPTGGGSKVAEPAPTAPAVDASSTGCPIAAPAAII